jgi:hypothetical protein
MYHPILLARRESKRLPPLGSGFVSKSFSPSDVPAHARFGFACVTCNGVTLRCALLVGLPSVVDHHTCTMSKEQPPSALLWLLCLGMHVHILLDACCCSSYPICTITVHPLSVVVVLLYPSVRPGHLHCVPKLVRCNSCNISLDIHPDSRRAYGQAYGHLGQDGSGDIWRHAIR